MPEVLAIQEEEKQLIQREYRKLLKAIKSEMDDNDQKMIRMAYELAVEAHSKQRRKSGEPYIMHPIAVAIICAEEIGLGPTAIVCALLHDVVEDTEVTPEEIEEMFGAQVRQLVEGVTKLSKFNFSSTTERQAENFRRMFLAMATVLFE